MIAFLGHPMVCVSACCLLSLMLLTDMLSYRAGYQRGQSSLGLHARTPQEAMIFESFVERYEEMKRAD